MEFVLILAAIVGGLLVAIVLVNASVEWSRAVCSIVRSRRDEPWGGILRRVLSTSVRSKGPWLLAAMLVVVTLLHREPWAPYFLATGTAWIAFVLANFLFAIVASWLYSAYSRKRAGQRKDDGAA